MDAFPKLEINLPHAGGTSPGLIGRLDHGSAERLPGRLALLEPLQRLLRGLIALARCLPVPVERLLVILRHALA